MAEFTTEIGRDSRKTARIYISALAMHIVLSIIAYGIGLYVLWSVRENIYIIDIIITAKLVSILNLMVVNGQIIKNSGNGNLVTRTLNGLIVLVCLAIFVVLAQKMIWPSASLNELRPEARLFIGAIQKNIFWISAFPIFAYFILDVVTYFVVRKNIIERTITAWYIIFSDIPCVIPLIFIIGLAVTFGHHVHLNHHAEIEVFVGGSITIIILVSAISSKVVDIFRARNEHFLNSALKV